MDPDATYRDLRETLDDYRACAPESAERAECAAHLVGLVSDLDEWLRKGGYLPGAWMAAKRDYE